MPTGKVKWYDADKGFGFLTRDDGGEVCVHSSALEGSGTALRAGQRVEFGVAEGRRGTQALQVRTLDPPPTVAKVSQKEFGRDRRDRRGPDQAAGRNIEHLPAGRHPDGRDAKKIAAVLRAVAADIEV